MPCGCVIEIMCLLEDGSLEWVEGREGGGEGLGSTRTTMTIHMGYHPLKTVSVVSV